MEWKKVYSFVIWNGGKVKLYKQHGFWNGITTDGFSILNNSVVDVVNIKFSSEAVLRDTREREKERPKVWTKLPNENIFMRWDENKQRNRFY